MIDPVLSVLEAESIEIIWNAVASGDKTVMLTSLGKDSSVMLHLARKAFAPAAIPFPLMHIDTRWKFREMYAYREELRTSGDIDLIVHQNSDLEARELTPFTHGSALFTDVMKTSALRTALDLHSFRIVLGGARRDEERSRAKERVFSVRTREHRWNPRHQRPELWRLYNSHIGYSQSLRVFPLSNWTELDVWRYIRQESIRVVGLYYAKPRPVVRRHGRLILVDDDRFPLEPMEHPEITCVRFRTLGCYPLTGAVESYAQTVDEIVNELSVSSVSERAGRLIDLDQPSSMERKKREGYF